VKRFLPILFFLPLFLSADSNNQQPSKLGSDKTDIFAIPLDTSPTEERQNREELRELEEELQEEAQEESES